MQLTSRTKATQSSSARYGPTQRSPMMLGESLYISLATRKKQRLCGQVRRAMRNRMKHLSLGQRSNLGRRRTIRVVKAKLEAHVINAALVSIRVRPNCINAMRLCAESIVVFLTIPGQDRLYKKGASLEKNAAMSLDRGASSSLAQAVRAVREKAAERGSPVSSLPTWSSVTIPP